MGEETEAGGRGGDYDAGGAAATGRRAAGGPADKTDGAFLPGDRVEVGPGVASSRRSRTPCTRSRRRCTGARRGRRRRCTPSLRHQPRRGQERGLTLDQLLKGARVPSAQKRRRRRGGQRTRWPRRPRRRRGHVDEFEASSRRRSGRRRVGCASARAGRRRSGCSGAWGFVGVGYDVFWTTVAVSCAARSVRPAGRTTFICCRQRRSGPPPRRCRQAPALGLRRRLLAARCGCAVRHGPERDSPRVCVARVCLCVGRGRVEVVASRRRPMVPRHRRRPREGRHRQAQVLRDPLAVERRLQPHRADEGAAARAGDAGRVIN